MPKIFIKVALFTFNMYCIAPAYPEIKINPSLSRMRTNSALDLHIYLSNEKYGQILRLRGGKVKYKDLKEVKERRMLRRGEKSSKRRHRAGARHKKKPDEETAKKENNTFYTFENL